MQAVLREVCLTANELLRHFWAAFPLSSPSREARALRLKKALADQYDRTTAMQVALAAFLLYVVLRQPLPVLALTPLKYLHCNS